jgi:hypothetical protein
MTEEINTNRICYLTDLRDEEGSIRIISDAGGCRMQIYEEGDWGELLLVESRRYQITTSGGRVIFDSSRIKWA